MRWNIHISHSNIRAAPCGGVIVVWTREEAVVRRDAVSSAQRKQLLLFSSDGVQLGQIDLDFGPVADVQVMMDETVIVATKSGLFRYYTDFGKNLVQLNINRAIESLKLSGDTCLAKLLAVDDERGDPTSFELVSVIRHSPVELRHKLLTLKTQTELLVEDWYPLNAVEDIGQAAGIILVDANAKAHLYDEDLSASSHRIVVEQVPLGILSVSSDNRKVCFGDATHNLVVYPSDFHKITIQTASTGAYKNVWWVGSDAIALETGSGEVGIISLNSSGSTRPATTYFEDDEVALFPEVDGLRVVGTKNHSLLVPVLQPTADIFKLGSLAPSAVLYSCVDQLDAGSPRPDQTVKQFDPKHLFGAIDTCIAAALLEVEPKSQKRLLRAALFGKSILEAYDSSRYLLALTRLRILNSLRSLSEAPFVITDRQLDELGIANLLHRLELRHLWPEALSIAELTRYPVEPIYVEWACWIIQNDDKSDDAELLTQLDSKLSRLGAYSRSKMATRALEKGRQNLAFNLLESEPVANDRVMLLLEMNSAQSALEQAVQSGDPFLVDYVLMILTEQLPFPQLMRLIGGNAVATERKVQLAQLNPESKDQLYEFLYHMDLREKSLQFEFEDIRREKDPLLQEKMLRILESKYIGHNKKTQSEGRACGEWADLLSIQRQLNADFGIEVAGQSASETITSLLKIPQLSQAQKLKVKLGISDRQFWWLRIRALIDRRDFIGLVDFAKSKKSPIGYQPFFDACYEAGNLETAAKFVDMISEASQEAKIHMFIKTKHLDKAKELFTKMKTRDPEISRLLEV